MKAKLLLTFFVAKPSVILKLTIEELPKMSGPLQRVDGGLKSNAKPKQFLT